MKNLCRNHRKIFCSELSSAEKFQEELLEEPMKKFLEKSFWKSPTYVWWDLLEIIAEIASEVSFCDFWRNLGKYLKESFFQQYFFCFFFYFCRDFQRDLSKDFSRKTFYWGACSDRYSWNVIPVKMEKEVYFITKNNFVQHTKIPKKNLEKVISKILQWPAQKRSIM